MNAVEFYAWVSNSALGQFMVNSAVAFPLSETFHFIGLCALMGALLVVDLRLLGLMSDVPPKLVLQFLPIAIGGFLINLITGVCFFAANPEGYSTNWMFWLKMGLVGLAGVNALYFTVVEEKRVLATPDGAQFDLQTRTTAALSLILWTGVIVAGRLLPVTQGAVGTG
jgi:uncharacterized membrane protein